MKQTRLIMVGGFLGAGKTTLLWESAIRLMQQGLRVGLITNDQAPELVDSELLRQQALQVAEVSGSCFCCNFNGFVEAFQRVKAEGAADVILAEPVGSCTDLSATIMQPLKHYWNAELRIAPLTVLADPMRLNAILSGESAGLHPDAAYIFRKQLEESDLILLNKCDLLSEEALADLKARTSAAFPQATILTASALHGTGLTEWLEAVMSRTDAGKRLLEIDYDTYAHGEAVLGWLNGTLMLHGTCADWDAWLRRLMEALATRFDAKGYAVGNLTGTRETLTLRGHAGAGEDLKLILNARVETTPEELNRLIKEVLTELLGDTLREEVLAWRFLQPGRPNPTHRFTQIVSIQ